MWRRFWSSRIFKHTLSAAVVGGRNAPPPSLLLITGWTPIQQSLGGATEIVLRRKTLLIPTTLSSSRFFSTDAGDQSNNGKEGGGGSGNGNGSENITCAEVKRLMRLVNVEALKMKLGMEGKEVIPYSELVEACQHMGIARSQDEANEFARVLDDAGVVLLFRDKVYLYPDKVVELVKRAMPLALTHEDDPVRTELRTLQERKEEIDMLAHKQVRRILWCGLGLGLLQVGLFFRLTFWEFSWDVMEPIGFFATTTGLIIGYAYFLFTSRDPTYQDLMKRLFLSRQRKLFKKQKFDVDRFKELQKKCRTPLDATTSLRNRAGLEVELDDAIHKD